MSKNRKYTIKVVAQVAMVIMLGILVMLVVVMIIEVNGCLIFARGNRV